MSPRRGGWRGGDSHAKAWCGRSRSQMDGGSTRRCSRCSLASRVTSTDKEVFVRILARFTGAPSLSAADYDRTLPVIEQSGEWPPRGLEYHVAFKASDGSF